MTRATTHRSSDVEFNGKLLYSFSAAATAAAATQRFGYFVAPCDGTIVQMEVNCDTSPTHATNNLSLGTVADIDSLLNEIDITDLATGRTDYIGHADVISLQVTKGEVYAWGWVGGDTTGELTTLLTIEPR